MLGIYARTFMGATGFHRPQIRPLHEDHKRHRRWKAGRWIDPPEEF
ncbi:hypothetical protein ACRARG_09270 [Pseudooceanicola sp. C21-150M6]